MQRAAIVMAGMLALAGAACSGGQPAAPVDKAEASRSTTSKPSSRRTTTVPTTARSTVPLPPTVVPTPVAPPTTVPATVGSTRPSVPTSTSPVAPPTGGATPMIEGCGVFPADNAWNQDVSTLAVHPNSAAYVASINSSGSTLHPDFGGGGAYGIPFITVGENEPARPVNWTAYGDESDAGPYPIPPEAPVEGGVESDGDRHVLAVQRGTCVLFELYRAFWRGDHWDADSGAVWDLRSNARRPLGWTSADAAGLPVLAGLVRYDEVAAGSVNHALRFTVSRTQRGYVLPATHFASSSNDPALPPMGLRLRLRSDFDMSGYTGQSLVILRALQRYGMIVADNGSSWFITGAADPRWDDDDLGQLKRVSGTAFEVVDTGPIQQ